METGGGVESRSLEMEEEGGIKRFRRHIHSGRRWACASLCWQPAEVEPHQG